MAIFILTWDASAAGYDPSDYAADIATTAAGGTVRYSRSVGNRTGGMNAGDRVFLLRQRADRGIVASGRVIDGIILEEPHWENPSKLACYVDVTWDRVVSVEKRLPIEDLLSSVPDHDWNHIHASGQQVQPPSDAALEARWEAYVTRDA